MPRLIAGAITLSLLIGVIAFCGVKYLYGDSRELRLTAALVVEDTSPLAQTFIEYIEEMESLAQLCQFVRTDEEAAYNMLDSGEAAAILIVPENTLEGILDGTNTPVRVVLREGFSLSAALLKELTAAGARSLSAAQSGIYTVYELYMENGVAESPDDACLSMNLKNLRFFAGRDRLFREKTVTATGELTVLQYYLSSGLVLFLLLWGISLNGYIRNESPALNGLLTARSLGLARRTLARLTAVFVLYLSVFVCLLLPVGILCRMPWAADRLSLPAGFASPAAGGFGIISSLLCAGALLLLAAAYAVFLYRLAPSPGGGILLLFTVSMALLFLSGGFIPLAFLPEPVRGISPALPSTVMIRLAGQLLTASGPSGMSRSLLAALVYAVLFYAGTVAVCHLRKEERP